MSSNSKNHKFLKNIKKYKFSEIFLKKNLIKIIQKDLLNGDLIILRSAFDKSLINQIKRYLISIGSNSLPKYYQLKNGIPNHHRIIRNDPRSYVKGCFHQFSFFNWNQDVFNFFEIFKKGYWLKNILSGNNKNEFLNINLNNEIISRICFQFYPAGCGYLNLHADPVGNHQLAAPILIMSEKSNNGDFKNGGGYVINTNNKKIFFEDHTKIGDIVLYDASIPHGVDIIDKKKKNNWLEFKGRWMMFFATNKVNDSKLIKNSKEINDVQL